MPVRSISMSYMDLEAAKDAILKISIANPKTAITLRDISSGTKLFQTMSFPTPIENFYLYCHHKIECEKCRFVNFKYEGYQLEALLTTELCSRPRQLLYINRRYVQGGRLTQFANDILMSVLQPADKRNQENCYPAFLFLITCKPSKVDMCFESNSFIQFKDWESVAMVVYRCIYSFLEAEEIEIPFDISEEEIACLSTPQPSLRSLLRQQSPSHNMKSSKVQRNLVPDLSGAKSPVVVDTPKKTNHSEFVPKYPEVFSEKLADLPAQDKDLKTPEKEVVSSRNTDTFITPPFKSKSLVKLQNAPVLNHLREAHDKLDKLDKRSMSLNKTYTVESRITGSSKIDVSLFNQSISSKRRSSTPLCPSKSKMLAINISPIKTAKSRQETKPTASRIQIKRKKSHKSTSSSASKKHTSTDTQSPFQELSALRHTFHLDFKTPKYFSQSSSNIFGKGIDPKKDSGYSETTSRQSHVTIDYNSKTTLSDRVDETPLFVTDEKISSYFCKTSLSGPGAGDQSSSAYIIEETVNSPKKFEVYCDQVVEDNQVTNKDKVEVHNNVADNYPKITSKDCASSPIKIPVDRGCSPINFTQMLNFEKSSNISSVNEPEKVVSPDPSFDISDSLLEHIDTKINEMNKSPDIEHNIPNIPESCDDQGQGEMSYLENSSPCLDCHTQKVTKRLNFASQKHDLQDIAEAEKDKENQMPVFQVLKPTSAAPHLVGDYEPWRKTASKITLKNVTSDFDVRKWKTDVFKTLGEGFMDAQHPFRGVNLLFNAHKFDKSVFDDIKVIGQIDDKFIGCVTKDSLVVLVDQHAAHERVRLECMWDQVNVNRDPAQGIQTKSLQHAIFIETAKSEREFILNMTAKLAFVGFDVILNHSITKNEISIISVPQICFTDTGSLNISIDDIKTAFFQTVDHIRESGGSNLALPPKLVTYLHSKACHGAIRFGDELSLKQCQELIRQLSACDLPFQCAHGRPSFAPIVNLKDSDSEVCDELKLLKLRSRFE